MSIARRSLTTADAPAVTAILNEQHEFEPAGILLDGEEIAEELRGPSVDLADGTVGWERDGQLIGLGALNVSPISDVWKAVLLGGVRVAEQRQGLGRRIVDELTVAAHRQRDRQAPGLSGELRIWVPQGRDSVTALARVTGFEPWRFYDDMRRDLSTELPTAPDPTGLRVLPWTDDWDESTRLASNASFADHYGSVPRDRERWRAQFAESAMFRPAVSRVAVDGDEVVAFVLVQEFQAETERNGFRTGYLAPVGTLNRCRGRGVASGLLAHVLRALREDGYRMADLEVDADSLTNAVRLYQRLGFARLRRNTLVGKRF